MLMALGDFVFELKSLAPDSVNKTVTANWAKAERFNNRPALQYAGIEGETLTISGVLYPFSGITGTTNDLKQIGDMAASGEEFLLSAADGYIKGLFAILSVRETHMVLDKRGAAQKIEFEISLERTDDDRIDPQP